MLLAAVCVVAPGIGYLADGRQGAIVAVAVGFFAFWALPVALESELLHRMFPRLPRSPWDD